MPPETSEIASAPPFVGVPTRERRIPTQNRARIKRDALLKAALEEFSEKAWDRVTTKTIAERAGVAAGTFYQYFESKESILRKLARERLTRLMDRIVDEDGSPLPGAAAGQSLEEQFRASLEFGYHYHAESPGLHRIIEERRSSDTELDEIMAAGEGRFLARVTAAVRSWGIADAEAVAFTIFGMAEGMVHRHVFDRPAVDAKSVLDHGARLIAGYLETLMAKK